MMARIPKIPFTLRMGPEERSALENLSKIEGRPINQLLNEAIKIYLSRLGRKERSLESSLAKLRAYRMRDPEFQNAISAFAKAEASLEDPLEGEPFEEAAASDARKPGPVQRRIRKALNA